MIMRYLLMLAASLAFAGNALAEDGEALAKKNHCIGCHGIDKRNVGPAFKEVAARYRGNESAQAMLEIKVRNGGGGAWGKLPMPPTRKWASEEDIKSIVQWVLSLK